MREIKFLLILFVLLSILMINWLKFNPYPPDFSYATPGYISGMQYVRHHYGVFYYRTDMFYLACKEAPKPHCVLIE